ncbi:MAG: ATP-binding protein [Fibromonadaceae bacterium]|jgi:hypothetical protein|nr:ATP-binding protein [Fibromonadaceae bacterium]
MTARKLPSGVQTFSQVRLDYDVYVDKTLHIYNMVNNYKVAFLSRPRRFGKSLTCSTLESLFANEKKLFISMHPNFSALCGITQEELEKKFDVEIEDGFKYLELKTKEEYLAKLKSYYNGYRFSSSGVSVYNPTSIIKHFLSPFAFKPFWIETGTPSFLVDYVKKQPDRLFNWKNKRISEVSFPQLYYEGYLTISSYDKESVSYTLDYPNEGARSALKQIEEKGYATAYKRVGVGARRCCPARKIIKLGVKFCSKKKNVVDWKSVK